MCEAFINDGTDGQAKSLFNSLNLQPELGLYHLVSMSGSHSTHVTPPRLPGVKMPEAGHD